MTSLVSSTEGLAYRTAGVGPPDLVFLHGWAGSGAYFAETLAALDLTRARATVVDLSEHGDSPAHDGAWSLDAIDDALLGVADAVGAGRFVPVGFSMSAKFVQHFACRHPERVAGLILVGGTPAAAFPLPPDVAEDWYGRAGNADAIKDLVRSFLTGPVDEAALDRFCQDAARIPRGALEASMRLTLESDFAALLPGLEVPTLAIGGARDEVFTADLLRDAILAPIKGARLALVDCGHEIPLERPRELAALIEAFLAGLRVS